LTDDIFRNIFKRLGGCIRAGIVIQNLDSFLEEFQNEGEKIIFGISIIGNKRGYNNVFVKKLGNEIKRGLKEYGVNSRFVLPMRKELSLNTAQLVKNNILERGFEFDIIVGNSREIYGRTEYVQDLGGFVKRDMNRPNANILMGTLPPKLARMMVNFTALKSGIIWDPFCGSGTIPMEAVTIGFNVLASDADDLAVASTDENIRWLNEDGSIDGILYETFKLDVTRPDSKIVKKLKNTDISAVVCEPFMGPPQKSPVSENRAEELLNSVGKLYKSLFDLFDNRIEKRGIRAVIIIPSYKTFNGWKTIGIREVAGNRWILKNSYYVRNKELRWYRQDSIIMRNIFILERS
jgi:tRNA G10  N-methylase Trm11